MKFLPRGSNNYTIALLLLLVLASLSLHIPSSTRAAADLSEKYQVTSTIELAAPLPPNHITVGDVKIQNVLNMSYICINQEDSPVPWNISQGELTWKSNNLTVQSVSITDNLGGNFTHLNYSNLYMNPPLHGTIPPNFTYVLSMVMVLNPGALYIDANKAWEFGTTLVTNLTAEASIIFPINFSVPYYSSGAAYSRNQYHKIARALVLRLFP
jgi:hypothetical protein